MADSDESTGDSKPKVDSADLKAKLGLKRVARRSAPAVKDPAARAQPSEEDVEAARAKAQEAMAEAGTPMEAFDPLGQETTPLPQRLPQEDLGALDIPGKGKFGLVPVLVAVVVVAVVGLMLGSVLGRAMNQKAQVAAHAQLAKDKLKYFQMDKTESGESTLEAIQTMKDALASATEAIDTVEAAKGDIVALEKPLQDLIPKMAHFMKDRAFINPEGVMEDLMIIYADDVMMEAVVFAVRTRHLHDTITAAVGEATSLLRIAKPSGTTTRTVLVQKEEKEIPEVGKIPVGVGRWVQDTGAPTQVKLIDPSNPANSQTEWQMMVLAEGAKDPVQVPTYDVLSLDISNVYNEQTQAIRKITVARLSALVRQADDVARGIDWTKLENSLKTWAAKGE